MLRPGAGGALNLVVDKDLGELAPWIHHGIGITPAQPYVRLPEGGSAGPVGSVHDPGGESAGSSRGEVDDRTATGGTHLHGGGRWIGNDPVDGAGHQRSR